MTNQKPDPTFPMYDLIPPTLTKLEQFVLENGHRSVDSLASELNRSEATISRTAGSAMAKQLEIEAIQMLIELAKNYLLNKPRYADANPRNFEVLSNRRMFLGGHGFLIIGYEVDNLLGQGDARRLGGTSYRIAHFRVPSGGVPLLQIELNA